VGPSAGGWKLPRYVVISLACSRGRGVRFTLHAEGRVANRVSNRARVTAAKACAGASATDLPLSVHADGSADVCQEHRPGRVPGHAWAPTACLSLVEITTDAPPIRCED
jgi:hypothetical protein